MRLTRREVLRFSGLGALVITFLPRVAFAARNSLQSIRTGVQPGNKTRLVIETALRPSYTLEYSENQMIVNIANMTTDDAVAAKLASDALVKSVNQIQNGDKLTLVVNLKKTIAPLNKNQIMVLEPNGDNDYRLVFDFAAGTPGKASTTQTQLTAITPAKKHVIIIDAGHGGKDPGCIGKGGTREKDVVLATAKKLKNKLDAAGFKTYMTRSNDSYLKLAERAELAEKHKGDLFISLHANANPSRSVKGFSIYTLSEKASDEEAQKLADAENAADKIDVSGFEQFSKDIRVALSSLQQHAVAEMSEEYASSCCQSLKRASVDQQPGPDVRHAPFAVLRSTVPGALIELGHLSNAKEEKLLKSSDHQNKLVNAIVKSIKNYNFEV